jgi:hypothetical protein
VIFSINFAARTPFFLAKRTKTFSQCAHVAALSNNVAALSRMPKFVWFILLRTGKAMKKCTPYSLLEQILFPEHKMTRSRLSSGENLRSEGDTEDSEVLKTHLLPVSKERKKMKMEKNMKKNKNKQISGVLDFFCMNRWKNPVRGQ